MTKGKDAVAIHGSEGTTYARLCPPPVKYAKMKSFEDISTIFDGLETHLAARLDQDVVEETCHFFSVRSRTANPNAHRIRIVKRLPEGTNVTSAGEPGSRRTRPGLPPNASAQREGVAPRGAEEGFAGSRPRPAGDGVPRARRRARRAGERARNHERARGARATSES